MLYILQTIVGNIITYSVMGLPAESKNVRMSNSLSNLDKMGVVKRTTSTDPTKFLVVENQPSNYNLDLHGIFTVLFNIGQKQYSLDFSLGQIHIAKTPICSMSSIPSSNLPELEF